MVHNNRTNSESDSDNESLIGSKQKRFAVIASSDEENIGQDNFTGNLSDNNSLEAIGPERLKNLSCDLQGVNVGVTQAEQVRDNSKSKSFQFKLLSASDLESENEADNEDLIKSSDVKKDGKSSDSECDNEDEDCVSPSRKEKSTHNRERTKKTSNVDNKLQIRSETQRMEREVVVNLPCHRPKQRTLREFLSRKKNHLKADALRLTTGNMIHTWEAIDKSIKETADFFKLDSEDDNSNEPPVILKSTEGDSVLPLENSESDSNQLTNYAIGASIEKIEISNLNYESICAPLPSDDCATVKCLDAEMDNIVNKEKTEVVLASQAIDIIDEVESQNKTEAWLKDIAAFERRENLRNKLQLSPSVLDKVPTLSNDDFVDLDNSDSESTELQPGAKLLMDRLLKFQKSAAMPKALIKTTVAERDETGQVQNVSIEVVPFTQSKALIPDGLKPGAKLQKFREKLRNEIEAKWEEEYKKRCLEIPVKQDYEENVESEEDIAYDGECDESSETESEPDEEDVIVKDKPRRFCEFGDSEAEESDAGEDADDSNDDNISNKCDVVEDAEEETDKEPEKDVTESEDLDCSLLPAFQPGGGLLMGGSTLTQQSQPLPLHAYSPASSPAIMKNSNPLTPVETSQRDKIKNETPETIQNYEQLTEVKSVKKNLFGADENIEDSDDPFLFVSGAFPEAPAAPSQHSLEQQSHSLSKLKRVIVMDDSDPENDDDNCEDKMIAAIEAKGVADSSNELELGKQNAKLPTKRATKLVYSDDSDGEEDKDANNSEEEECDDERNDGSDVEYDSEENEVTKVRPGEFFEQEAELSESEWSGDEDEKGLDVLEAEAGDADVLDEEQVASQLGRIHMRRVLDEDARDVRLLKELLLEDGDLHTDGKARDRKFRWKNLSAGFDLNSEHMDNDGSDGETDAIDAALVKLRHEKTQFLLQLQQEGKLDSLEEECSGKENSVIALGKQLLQRLRSGPLAPSTTSASKSVFSRGSFLSKDERFLSRLSRVATGGTDGPLGPSNSKNFVFAVQDKEEVMEETVNTQGLKRKAVSCKETVKRAKITFKNQPSLLDQLS